MKTLIIIGFSVQIVPIAFMVYYFVKNQVWKTL